MKQVVILTQEAFDKEPDDFKLDMTFEDYINIQLLMLDEEDMVVETISHSDDLKRFVIVYKHVTGRNTKK